MGNTKSININNTIDEIPKDMSLEEKLHFIASHYILTMDFQSLRKLYEREYCEKLVILTSSILNKYYDDTELNKILDKINKNSSQEEQGEQISNMNVYFKKDIEKMNLPNGEKREMICHQISKFYIKIAHIFSAIITTINPEYIYTDYLGNKKKVKFYEKDTIPKDAKVEVKKLNLCDERIDSLKGEKNDSILTEQDISKIKIMPTFCEVELKGDKTLEDEPGIPELMELYYDDGYDYKTGQFTSMSEETKQRYYNDLKRFYKEFTGSNDLNAEIKKFSDIKIKHYNKEPVCSKKEQTINGEKIDENNIVYKEFLFTQYANNLKQMIVSVNERQKTLLKIINLLFVHDKERKLITINPDLNSKSLQMIVVETRNLIVQLYLKCEIDYNIGIKIYDAIIESTIQHSLEKQINTLEKEKEKLYDNLKPTTTSS